MLKSAISSLAFALVIIATPALAYPVEVQSCFDKVTFDGPPKRPVVNDLNLVQTVIDMGLIDRFVGVAGIGGGEKEIVAPPGEMDKIKQFSDRYPTTEAILGQNADFYFAGWQYGLSEPDVTPKRLAETGVKTYVLYESCIRVGPRPPISMETMYADIVALGQTRPRMMYCGFCNTDNPPRTIGAEGMPRLLFDLAGGKNIFDDIKDSYVNVSWDVVIDRDPEWIVVSNPRISHEDIVNYLTTSPALKNVSAVKNRHILFMTYAERSPSPRNVDALERLAKAIHPELFGQ
jgi:iron complex transport system substrate-binding protein